MAKIDKGARKGASVAAEQTDRKRVWDARDGGPVKAPKAEKVAPAPKAEPDK